MMKQDGHRINRKRVYRIWRQEGLQLPRRRKVKRRYGDHTATLRPADGPNDVWTYDFLEGRTERGGKLRMLTVLDEYTRECLAIHVARSISSRQGIEVLDWLFLVRGAPGHLRSDNGPEFVAHALQDWLEKRNSHTLTITPGSPWENPFIESSTAHFVVNVWTVGCSPAAGRHSSLSNNGVRSIIIVVRTADWAMCLRLCFRTKLDSHSKWSSLWRQVTSTAAILLPAA